MQPFDGGGGPAGPPGGASPTGFDDPTAGVGDIDSQSPSQPFSDVPVPADFGGQGTAKEALLNLLGQIQESQGVDLVSLLSSLKPPPGPTQTKPGMPVPGEGKPKGLGLKKDDEDDLAKELCDLCDRYQQAVESMVEQEQEIRDAYRMASSNGSRSPGLSEADALVSEFMMVQVDQITARLVTNITSVEPFVQVDPVRGSVYDDPAMKKLADKTQSFLREYVWNDVDFSHLLPLIVHRLVKVGTAVVRVGWETEDKESSYYVGQEEVTKSVRVGGVRARLYENRQVIVWPPTAHNWQRDADVVGHESYHSRSAWKRLAADWELTDEVVQMVEGMPGEKPDDEQNDRTTRREGIDSSRMDDQKLLTPQVKLTELWCNLWLPSPYNRRVKFQVILHRPTKRILWSDLNSHFTRKHPYFPVRYKWSDLSAWGTGVGHETINCWAADTALWNLSMENLAAGAFNIVIRNANQAHAVQTRPVRPGMEVTSPDPNNDFIVRSMGGDAAELPLTRQENEQRLKKATGTPDVAMGMGDQTMKSGAGTGSTNALIEQASTKIRFTDQTIREDLTPLFAFILELVCQYGNEGIFYNVVGEDDAAILERLRYVPPRGMEISSLFRIRAMAPSASSSTEARRNSLMMIWGFAQSAVQVINQFASQVLADNPAGLQRWQYAVAATLHEIMRRTLEINEIPGVNSIFPTGLPSLTPQDEQVNNATAQLQQAQQLIAQLQKQLAVLTGGGADIPKQVGGPTPAGQPPGGGAPPPDQGQQGQPGGGAAQPPGGSPPMPPQTMEPPHGR